MKQTFKARLTAHGPGGAWTFLDIPFDAAKVFGSKARIAVCGTLNGFAFRSSLSPNGDGTHSMAVNKSLQAGAGAAAGDEVSVVMEVDTRARSVKVPAELKAALDSAPDAAKIYAALAPSHRKEFAEWVGGAKQETTRQARAQKALGLIRQRAHTR